MSLIKRILRYLSPYKVRLSAGLVSMVFHSFFTIFFVKVFQDLIETIINDISAGGTGLQKLNWIALSMVLIYFLKGISYYGQKYLISYVSQKAVKDIREELYSHLQGLSLSFYNKNKTGEIISRVTNDVGKLQNSIVSSAITLVDQTLTLLGGIAYLFYLNVRLTLLLVVMIPLMTYVLAKFNRKIRRVSKKVQIRIADISDILQETLSAVRVVKSFGREDYELSRFQEKNDSNFRAKVKTAQYGAVLTPIIELIAAMAFTAILWYGGYEVFRGRMQPSALIAYFTLLLTITSPLRSMSKLSSTVQKALAAAERVFETMDIHNHLKEEVKDAEVLSSVEGHVEFVDVSFSYNEGEEVLSDINLQALPGEIVALVGPSGAGKTTLVDLIPKFYQPDSGVICLDGKDINKVNLASLRKFIGIVPQETVLFSGTIKDNIRYGNLEASDEEIIAAARAANAHDFVMKFPKQYESLVGERGVGLSGGQRQRIAIARAILKNPRILILDEATSALDAESESLVQEALDRLMQNRTTFVIAHRLTTIKNADKIIVVSGGRIKEKGTHDELIARGGVYSRLYQGQFTE